MATATPPSSHYTASTPPFSHSSITQISIPVSIKLDRTNFLTWKSQIEPIVDGHGLAKHLDPAISPPDRQLVIDNQNLDNPAFLPWYMQDRLLLGWLRSTISGDILSQYVKCQTAASLWTDLHQAYSAVSSARIMEMRRLLQSTTKGGQSCNDYFEQMRSFADQLSAAGEPISDSELVRYILGGLGSDYNSFVVAINTRSNPISLTELRSFLTAHEALLTTQIGAAFSSLPSVQNSAAFYTNPRSGSNSRQYNPRPAHQRPYSQSGSRPKSSQPKLAYS